MDDKPANLLALDAVLGSIGVPIVAADSGDDALRQLLTHGDNIAVMLLDVQMPGLDGFETAKLIRGRDSLKHLPIIFITAVNREEAHIVKGYAQDAVDYIVKPFNADVLRTKVKFFVEAHRRTMSLRRDRQQSEQRLTLALDAVELGAWSWDETSGRAVCDERCRRMLGLSRDAPLDLGSFGFDANSVPTDDAKLRSECRTAAGGWLLAQGRAYRDIDGCVRVVGILADISEDKRAQLERELFLGALGHDLRNPLNAIMISASALAARDEPPVARTGDQIVRSAERMADLISDMLDFVRSRVGPMRIEPSPTDLNAICREVIAEIEIASGRRIAFSPCESAEGLWDPGRVGQIVQNLLINAVHHGAADHDIRVTTRRSGDESIFEVENAGEPIPEEVRSRIFEPFVSRGSAGMGLGLYISNQLVQAHGGRIDLASGDGQTTFRVTLPTGSWDIASRAKSA